MKERYRQGTVSDVEVKDRLTHSLNAFLEPIRAKRKALEAEKGLVEQIIYDGTMKMIDLTQDVIKEMKSLMGLSGTWNKISRMAREHKQ